jgi:hypothetical protein
VGFGFVMLRSRAWCNFQTLAFSSKAGYGIDFCRVISCATAAAAAVHLYSVNSVL